MELFFLVVLMIIMGAALGSGFPVAFALPGSAIITIGLAAASGYFFGGSVDAFFHSGGPSQWLTAGVTNLRGVYWEVERDTLIAIPLFIFMGIMLQRSKIAEDLLVAMAQLFGPVPGGLGISVVFVGALLAATTGIVAQPWLPWVLSLFRPCCGTTTRLHWRQGQLRLRVLWGRSFHPLSC